MFADKKVITAFRACFIASFTAGFICFLISIPAIWGIGISGGALLGTSVVYSLGAFLVGSGIAVTYGLPMYFLLSRYKRNTYPNIAIAGAVPGLIFAMLGPNIFFAASVVVGIATACTYHHLTLAAEHVQSAR